MLKENIKTIRKSKGLTQEELAIRLNVVRQTISKWEKGQSVPDAEILIQIADIFEISVSELLGTELENEKELSEIALQLSRINEQLAVMNRRARRIWHITAAVFSVIIIVLISIFIYNTIDFNSISTEYSPTPDIDYPQTTPHEPNADSDILDLETENELYRATAEEEALVKSEINALVAELEEQDGYIAVGTGSFVWPVPSSANVVSSFGVRLHPVYQVYRNHSGIDIAAVDGADVVAADSGTVIISAYSEVYGYYIVISHGYGITTLYAQLSMNEVEQGDVVTQGDVIGNVGSTGTARAPHLHFEIFADGSRADPMRYY